MKKIILSILVLALVGAAGVYYYAFVYSKNRKIDMVNAEAITVESNALVKAFQEDPTNKNYLGKVLMINGTVSATGNAQTGQRTITLSSDDPFVGVFVTLDSTELSTVNMNQKVTLKGMCEGILTDVVITSAIVVK
jgi:hypothetical protein